MLGVETIAHVRENGRITIMFCAFEGPPRITRLFGRGTHYIFLPLDVGIHLMLMQRDCTRIWHTRIRIHHTRR